jgi:hypothetical protein
MEIKDKRGVSRCLSFNVIRDLSVFCIIRYVFNYVINDLKGLGLEIINN